MYTDVRELSSVGFVEKSLSFGGAVFVLSAVVATDDFGCKLRAVLNTV